MDFWSETLAHSNNNKNSRNVPKEFMLPCAMSVVSQSSLSHYEKSHDVIILGILTKNLRHKVTSVLTHSQKACLWRSSQDQDMSSLAQMV